MKTFLLISGIFLHLLLAGNLLAQSKRPKNPKGIFGVADNALENPRTFGNRQKGLTDNYFEGDSSASNGNDSQSIKKKEIKRKNSSSKKETKNAEKAVQKAYDEGNIELY